MNNDTTRDEIHYVEGFLCRAWGETDLPEARLVRTRPEWEAFVVVAQWGDGAKYETLDAHEREMVDGQVKYIAQDMGDNGTGEIRFEIGGVSVERVTFPESRRAACSSPPDGLAAAVERLKEAHASSTRGKWRKGISSHETVTDFGEHKGYLIGEFHHADDANFCDVAHEVAPIIFNALAGVSLPDGLALLTDAKAALEDYNPEWAKTVASAITTFLAAVSLPDGGAAERAYVDQRVKGLRWPEGYCLDPNGKVCVPAGKDEDFSFGYDLGYADGLMAQSAALAAPSAQPVELIEKSPRVVNPMAEWPWESTSAQPPVDMILFCPKCGMQHVDAPEGQFIPGFTAEESTAWCAEHRLWSNPPHRSHLCHGCGFIWRPADVPTNGVAAIKTKGKNDSPASPSAQPSGAPEVQPVHESWWLVEATFAPVPLYYAGHHRDGKGPTMIAEAGRAVRFPDEESAMFTICHALGIPVGMGATLNHRGYAVCEHIFDYTPRVTAPTPTAGAPEVQPDIRERVRRAVESAGLMNETLGDRVPLGHLVRFATALFATTPATSAGAPAEWDNNPDGIKPGQDSPVRMDPGTGAWDAPNSDDAAVGRKT